MRMKRMSTLVAVLLLLAFAVTACTPKTPAPVGPNVTPPEHATGFSIEYLEGGAKILVDGGGQRILLLPEGVTAPADVSYDVEISGPVERAVALSTTQAGHFAKLGIVDKLKGVATAVDKWYIPEIKAAVEEGEIVNVGDDNEAIMALDPDVVFHGAAARDVERAALLKTAGLICVQFDDSKEDHYLGRGEWVKFVGAFFDQEVAAEQLVAANKQRVTAVTDQAANISERPQVLWFYYSSSGVNWNVYTDLDYVSTLVEAAGGTLLVPAGLTESNESTAVKVQDEDFLSLMLEADVIIFGRSLASYPDARDLTYFNNSAIDFSEAPAFQLGNCYTVASDWFQATADVAPIIESLAALLQPNTFSDLLVTKFTQFFLE